MLLGTDRLFRRFQQTGDPRLLGQVFDRTAAELLKVALHLTRDRHRAEDLLQSTFLSAIEKARTFDPERRVLPWLLTILANHARQAHRRERLPLPVPRAEGTEGDVADLVGAREVADACDRAVDALPEPYRHVLLLHLRHGMSGQEIAHTLDRPDSTVRNQIARGLDLLRRRLPAGVATAAVLMTGGRGLAAVRAAVLTRVPPGAGVAALPLTLGVLLMSKKILVPFVLLFALAATWQGGAFVSRDVVEQPRSEPSALVAATGVIDDVPPQALPGHADRTELPAAEPATGSFHVAVFTESKREPAADITVHVVPDLEREQTMVIAEGRTGPDGTVVLAGLPAGAWRVKLPGRSEASYSQAANGDTTQVQIVVSDGNRIEGSVVDRAGRPIAGAEVRCDGKVRSSLLTRTDASGRFVAASLSSVELWAAVEGRQPSAKHEVRDDCTVRFVIGDSGNRLTGRVVDEAGSPVAAATVVLGLDDPAGRNRRRMVDLRAAADGTFRVDWLPPGNLFVGALPADDDLARLTGQWLDIEAGVPASIVLQLGGGACVTGQVRDEQGAPVAEVMVQSNAERDPWLTGISSRWTTSGADGTFQLPGLLAGACELRTNWRYGTIAVTARLQLERGQQLRWDPVLVAGRTLAVQVLDPDGTPMVGCHVEMTAGKDTLWRADTGSEGRCHLEHLPDTACSLSVSSATWAPLLEEPAVVAGSEELVLRVDRSRMPNARVRGRVVDARGNPVPGVTVSMVTGNHALRHQTSPEGTFLITQLSPGARYLAFSSDNATFAHGGRTVILVADQEQDIGCVTLPEAATLTVRVAAEGGAAMRGVVVSLDQAGHPAAVSVARDEVDGVYRCPRLDPGSYLLRCFAADGVPQCVPLVLGPGEHRQLDVVMERGVPVVVELRCVDRRQSGIVNGMLTVTDANGVQVLVRRLWGYFDDHEQRLVRVRLGLKPGKYRIDARENAERSTEVVVGAEVPGPVVLDLR